MMIEVNAMSSAVSVGAASVTGLLISFLIERLLDPRPSVRRPWGAWALHAGLWLGIHAVLIIVLGRPWFAMVVLCAGMLVLTVVSNAKYHSLREPFVFQDYQYFSDAIMHPRLYIPFLGWRNFLVGLAATSFACFAGMTAEPVLLRTDVALMGLAPACLLMLVAFLFLLIAKRASLQPCFDPEADIIRLGLLPCLYLYATESRKPPKISAAEIAKPGRPPRLPRGEWPHLLAVQSESFFDPRPLIPEIREDVLAAFDAIRQQAVLQGRLRVPAWGANTVRTEFAFLSALDPASLGVHRFNPYLSVATHWPGNTLASTLKNRGYRTICIHPYVGSFYGRKRVMPLLGFDEFLDIRAFPGARHEGPFVSDSAMAEAIIRFLEKAAEPVFIFAVTMENHGPLHLETVRRGDAEQCYTSAPPAGCDELTIYLRHLHNADQMIRKLHHGLSGLSRAASLCWYGDHVPILPEVYRHYGHPSGDSEFFIWSSRCVPHRDPETLAAHQLAKHWLESVEFGLYGSDATALPHSSGLEGAGRSRAE